MGAEPFTGSISMAIDKADRSDPRDAVMLQLPRRRALMTLGREMRAAISIARLFVHP